MTEQDIEARLCPIFSTVLKVPPERVDEGLSPESCDTWDSLQHIHLVNASEEEFEMMLAFEQQVQMVSFVDARQIVHDVTSAA